MAFHKLEIEGNFFNMRKNINKNLQLIPDFMRKLDALLLRTGARQGCLLVPLLFNIIWEVLNDATKQGKEIKSI